LKEPWSQNLVVKYRASFDRQIPTVQSGGASWDASISYANLDAVREDEAEKLYVSADAFLNRPLLRWLLPEWSSLIGFSIGKESKGQAFRHSLGAMSPTRNKLAPEEYGMCSCSLRSGNTPSSRKDDPS
jgi:hypothetical protein